MDNEELTLRDYFAAMAMQAHLSRRAWDDCRFVPKKAYEMADAMLAERQELLDARGESYG